MRKVLKNKKRIVLKVGSSVLVDSQGRLNGVRCRALAQEVAVLMERKIRVVLVSSGAIAAGLHRLGIKTKPQKIPLKQAIAAAGQTTMMQQYEKAFAKHKIKVAQVLLTREDLANRKRFLNARHTLYELYQLGIVPIINENDTVAVHEIKVGDNDNLGALVTHLVEADLMINLSDVDGVYDSDPRLNPQAQRLSVLHHIDGLLKSRASDSLRLGGTGGMWTKLEAAEKAQRFGVATVIANGRKKGVLQKILDGDDIGTLITPKEGRDRLSARKYWLAYTLRPMGTLVVDAGAKSALVEKGRSLLPSGVLSCEGHFRQGDPVDLKLSDGAPFARGLAGYSSVEIRKIMGCKSIDVEKVLGYKYFDELVHRNDMVLLGEE